ncbi:hypothetical protein, partial [Daejeonella sp.]|uniref:hypothetical protein n=1 Tax=Daejeonella sp. TaxID=2805397 RepID=UPI002730EBD4
MLKFILFFFLVIPFATEAAEIRGQQPNVGIDTKGIIRMVYGEGEKIYCITSTNNGNNFSNP